MRNTEPEVAVAIAVEYDTPAVYIPNNEDLPPASSPTVCIPNNENLFPVTAQSALIADAKNKLSSE